MILTSVKTAGWGCASACMAEGGRPAAMTSLADTLRLHALMRGQDTFAWAGAFQWPPTETTSANWRWMSGAPWNYTNFKDGEPNDSDGPQSCIMVMNSALWDDQQCGLELPCACELVVGVPRQANALNVTLAALEANDCEWAARQMRLYLVCCSVLLLLFPLLFLSIYRQQSMGRMGAGMLGETSQAATKDVAMIERLDAAAQKYKQVRMRVVGLLLNVGWALLALGLLPLTMGTGPWPSTSLGSRGWPITRGYHSYHLIMSPVGYCLMQLAVAPNSPVGVRIVSIALVLLCAMGVFTLGGFIITQSADAFADVLYVCGVMIVSVTGGSILISMRSSVPPRLSLIRLWRIYRTFLVVISLFKTVYVIRSISEERGWISHTYFWGDVGLSIALAMCGAIVTAEVRGHVLARLGGLGQHEVDMAAAAATIASFVGGHSTGESLHAASGRFLVLPVAKMREEDLASNVAAADLRSRTQRAKLGECDAFLSHSW